MTLQDIIRRSETTANGCWEWRGPIANTGYARPNGHAELVHRTSYRLRYGEIPEGKQLHHKCGVRHCVNPDHLEAVTPQEHRDRHPRPGVGSKPRERCRKHGHPMSPENVYVSGGRRWCKACVQIARARRAARSAPKGRRVERIGEGSLSS